MNYSEVQSMIRSLSFTYLFIVLAVGYLGGTVLFRELPTASTEKLLTFFDARVVEGQEATFIWPALFTLLFFVLAFGLSKFKYSRFFVLFLGAIKAVIFGLSSGYLLATGMKILTYTIWWFPFQLLICFVYLLYCAILAPPFFLRTKGKKNGNQKVLLLLIGTGVLLTMSEFAIFYLMLK